MQRLCQRDFWLFMAEDPLEALTRNENRSLSGSGLDLIHWFAGG